MANLFWNRVNDHFGSDQIPFLQFGLCKVDHFAQNIEVDGSLLHRLRINNKVNKLCSLYTWYLDPKHNYSMQDSTSRNNIDCLTEGRVRLLTRLQELYISVQKYFIGFEYFLNLLCESSSCFDVAFTLDCGDPDFFYAAAVLEMLEKGIYDPFGITEFLTNCKDYALESYWFFVYFGHTEQLFDTYLQTLLYFIFIDPHEGQCLEGVHLNGFLQIDRAWLFNDTSFV